MEDYSAVSVDYARNEACFAVYDGHGGQDAAKFCQRDLVNNIRKQRGFYSTDDEKIRFAVKQGFEETQRSMWNSIDKWSKHPRGYSSTAGSTASIVVVRGNKLIVAHVGDSTVTLCRQGEGDVLKTVQLTDEHKPNSPLEQARIEQDGGRVEKRGSVHRVAWRRVRQPHTGPIRRSTTFDIVPFLAVSRALGNLWSYNYFTKKYTVSPEPDVCVRTLQYGKDRYIVLASDGVWNVMSNEDVANFVHSRSGHEDVARRLVFEAFRRWNERKWRADNITAIVLTLEEPMKEQCTGHMTPVQPITEQYTLSLTCYGQTPTTFDELSSQSKRGIKRSLSQSQLSSNDLSEEGPPVKRYHSLPGNIHTDSSY